MRFKMESNVYVLRKTRSIDVPVANMISPASEISGNTPCTRPSSLENVSPRINTVSHLPSQDLWHDSLVLAEVGKATKISEDGLELPKVQNSKCFSTVSDLRLADTENNPTSDTGFPERPYKVSTLLQDRIRVLECEVRKYLTDAKEAIQQAEMEGKRKRSTSLPSIESVKSSLQSGKDANKPFNGVQKHQPGVGRHKETTPNSRLPGSKRLPKLKTESSASEAVSGGKRSDERKHFQTHGADPNGKEHTQLPLKGNSNKNNSTLDSTVEKHTTFNGKKDEKQENVATKEKPVISMLQIAEKALGDNAGGLDDKRLQNTTKDIRSPVPLRILKKPKNSAAKPNNFPNL